MYVALDPGPDLGWAVWDDTGKFVESGIIRGLTKQPAGLACIADKYPPCTVIVEAWGMYNKDAVYTNWGKDAIMSEGMCMYWAMQWSARYVEQPSNILPIGEKWTGLKVKKGKAHKDSHDTSARIHGEYFFISTGIKPHPLDSSAQQAKAV